MQEEKTSKVSILTDGFLKNNPVLVLILGTCPTLALTTEAVNGIGMGIAATLVLIGSNVIIAMLKNIIPDTVRIPCYIVIIAGFVAFVELIVKAYFPAINEALGIYLPLIAVNCIILGRAEMFASKNSVLDSFLDGVGMGVGFTLALLIIGSIREIIGAGTWFGIPITKDLFSPIGVMIIAPGGFFVYGMVIACVNKFLAMRGKTIKRTSFDCEACPVAEDGCDICDVEREGE